MAQWPTLPRIAWSPRARGWSVLPFTHFQPSPLFPVCAGVVGFDISAIDFPYSGPRVRGGERLKSQSKGNTFPG